MRTIFSAFLIFWTSLGIAQEDSISANVVDEHLLEGIASASAMHSKNDFHYIASDDSPWLYVLDEDLTVVRKFLIHDHLHEGFARIPADVKPDYEAMVNYKWKSKDLLIFGSGSGEMRKMMVRVDHTDRGYEVKSYTLEHLYNQMMEKGNIPPEKLNIEGVASWRDHIVFLNRGTNQVIMIRKFRFDRFMKKDEDDQKDSNLLIDFYNFELPVVGGVRASFSGAQKVKGEHLLAFTATLERDASGATDGEILGSYVGLIELKKVNQGEVRIARVMKNGKPYAGKIESLDVFDVSESELKIHAVTDNDDGTSQFLRIKMTR